MSIRIDSYERIEDQVVAWNAASGNSATGYTIAISPAHVPSEAKGLLDQMIARANASTHHTATEGHDHQGATDNVEVEPGLLRAIYNEAESAARRLEDADSDAATPEASAAMGRITLALVKLDRDNAIGLDTED